MNFPLRCVTSLVLSPLLLPGVGFAGGPLSLAGTNGETPVVYANGGSNITLNFDQGSLGSRTNAQADALVNQAINRWNGVTTSTLRLRQGADLPVDVTTANVSQYLYSYSDGLNPVVYDSDGSITDALFGVGAKQHILGFAGSSYFSSTARFAEGRAVINGSIPISDATLVNVLAHEIGHFFGLDHTQLDSTQGLASSNYALMYPIAYRTLASLHEDDIAAVSALYPASSVAESYGELTGEFLTTSYTPILGANIWAAETSTGKVYSCVSDYLTQGNGYFRLLLPPGVYTLHAESIQSNFTGGSSVGPYSESATSASFQSPHPITPVTFTGATPGSAQEIAINAGCSTEVTFLLSGSGFVSAGGCAGAALPVADAGSDQTVSFGSQVTLNGSGSTNASGGITGYQWNQVAGAPTVSLNGASGAIATFTAPQVAASLTFRLTVTNEGGASSTDEVRVTVQAPANTPPTASAGPDQTVAQGSAVRLDGTASTDGDGTIVSFQWAQITGTSVALTNANTATAGFSAPVGSRRVRLPLTLGFRLTVTDNRGAKASDDVTVTVVEQVQTNTPPVAAAGTDQTVSPGGAVTLNGSGSRDTDGTIVTYRWTQVGGTPSVTLSNGNSSVASFTAPSSAATLTFRLTVTDDRGASASDDVTVTVTQTTGANSPPVANAGSDQIVAQGALVRLNGSSSRDSDGSIIAYRWTQLSGSGVALAGANTATPTFSAPLGTRRVRLPLALTFRLTVTDDRGASASDNVTVTVVSELAGNAAPVAVAGSDRTVAPGTSVTLDGSASADSDGRIVSYQWVQISGSPTVGITGASNPTAVFTAPAAGSVLIFRLTVADDLGASASDEVAVTVAQASPENAPPTANAGPDQQVSSGTLVTLDGHGSSDSDGGIAAYAWAQVEGSLVTLSNPQTARPSFVASLSDRRVRFPTSLKFRLTVTDTGGARASDEVTVTLLR